MRCSCLISKSYRRDSAAYDSSNSWEDLVLWWPPHTNVLPPFSLFTSTTTTTTTHWEQTSLKFIRGDKLIGWGVCHSGCLFVVAHLLLCTGNAGAIGTRWSTDWTRITAVFRLCSSQLRQDKIDSHFKNVSFIVRNIMFSKASLFMWHSNWMQGGRSGHKRAGLCAGAEPNLTSDHDKRCVYETADRTATKVNYYSFLYYYVFKVWSKALLKAEINVL